MEGCPWEGEACWLRRHVFGEGRFLGEGWGGGCEWCSCHSGLWWVNFLGEEYRLQIERRMELYFLRIGKQKVTVGVRYLG